MTNHVHLAIDLGSMPTTYGVNVFAISIFLISLADSDIFGIDLKGSRLSDNNAVGFELKFEDGSPPHAIMRWDGIPGITRWADKLIALKKQFENYDLVNWSNISYTQMFQMIS